MSAFTWAGFYPTVQTVLRAPTEAPGKLLFRVPAVGRVRVIRACSVNSGSSFDKYEMPVEVSPKDHGTTPLPNIADLQGKISERVYQNLAGYGFHRLSPVQAHCIPLLLAGHDVMACAQTGSGKTIMFLVPAISSLLSRRQRALSSGAGGPARPRILILAPTRELAMQIFGEAQKLSKNTGLKSVCVYGGDSVRQQATKLNGGCDVMIATPGRLQMFVDKGAVSLREVSFLVVDEADRMLDMGFEPQLQYLVRRLGKSGHRSNVMCSATFPEDIQYLAANFLDENYSFVTVGRVGSTTELIKQNLLWVEDDRKEAQLLSLLRKRAGIDKRTLIFTNTKVEAQAVGSMLSKNSQSERHEALKRFKSGATPILIATDIASRGLDISGIDHVIQYDAAKDSDTYTHRIGRTGRGGQRGVATAFVNSKQKGCAAGILRQLREVSQPQPTWLIGMAHVAQREHEILVSNKAGVTEASGDDVDFGGQDFRKTAKKGTWGSQKDLRFQNFDEKAYATSTSDASETQSSEDENGTSASNDSEAYSSPENDTSIIEGASGVLEGLGTDEIDAALDEDMEDVDEPSEEERKRQAIESYKRPEASSELLNVLERSRLVLGDEPSPRVEKLLSSRRKLFYEYMGLFPPELIETSQSRFADATGGMKKVLMVAEKPSVAESIARVLSKNRLRKRRGLGRNVPVFEFSTSFPSTREKVLVRVTSVVGHVFSLSFKNDTDNDWRKDPQLLFKCDTQKTVEDTTNKLRIVEHLQNEAAGCSYLALWLDGDREGENIAYEVISVTRDSFPTDESIFRARFSALTEQELESAYGSLGQPNPNESMAVDARQELDLKVGVAFSRLFTNRFSRLVREKFSPATKLLSYGPCQTPTLFFCVKRFQEMKAFQRQSYWTVKVLADVEGEVVLRWSKGDTFDEREARQVETELNRRKEGKVTRVRVAEKKQRAPNGLNTVQMLMTCSKAMGISPKKAMSVAEKLYTAGYVSYPRTESTQYPPSMDINSVITEHRNHPDWGKTADFVARRKPSVPSGGKNVGDHPPITPTRVATRSDLAGGLEWRVYEFITRHFLGSLLGDLQYRELTSDIQVGSLTLMHKQAIVDEPGFAGAMTWNLQDIYRTDEEFRTKNQLGKSRRAEFQRLREDSAVTIKKVRVDREETNPPEFLQEHELVGLMDQHGIGTDASMASHVSTIVDRNYVVVCDKEGVPIPVGMKPGTSNRKPAGGRYMVPTALGVSIVEGIQRVDEKLVLPEIRAMMETEVTSIANGELDKAEVMEKNLEWFEQRFENFRNNMRSMEQELRNSLKPNKPHLRETRNFFPLAGSEPADRSSRPPQNRGNNKNRRGQSTRRPPPRR